MRSRFRDLLICGAAVAVAFFGLSSTALAATAAPVRSVTSAGAPGAAATVTRAAAAETAHVVTAHAVPGGTLLELVSPRAPSGCPSGAICFYRQGNGGSLCNYYYGNASSLGGCANIGPSGSIYNNGNACSGCQDVNLYYSANYGGAYYCLPMGHYLLYIEQNYFNRGNGKAGFNQTLAYRPGQPNGPGGVASERWGTC